MKSRKQRKAKLHAAATLDAEAFLAELMADVRNGDLARATQKIDARRKIVDRHAFASYLAGLIRVSAGDELQAIGHFDRVIALDPNHAQALYGRAVSLQRCGRAEEAIADYERSLRLDPGNPEAWFNFGVAHQLSQRFDAAIAAYSKALDLSADHAQALANRALALHALGRDAEALADYDRAVALPQADAVLWRNRAVSSMRVGRVEAALASFETAFALDASYLDAADGVMFALFELKRFDEAVAFCDDVLARAPLHPQALLTKANSLHELKRFAEALQVFDAAAALAPDDVKTLTNRGMTLFELGRLDEAHESAMAAIARAPDFALAWRCRGMVEMRRASLDDALASFDIAASLSGPDADILCGRAIVAKELGRFEDSLADFDRALEIDPRHAEAKANKGSLLLLLGRFEEGLELFEHRWVLNDTPKSEVTYRWPEWRGEPLAGKSIIVLDEAGLGDSLQFSRYAPLLAAAGAKVTFQCRPSLVAMMRSLGPGVEIVETPPSGATYDYCVTLCSLPRAFATRANNIPSQPYLRADAHRVATWRERLRGDDFKIGIAWHGSSHSRSDHTRAAPLAAFAPLASLDGVRLVSLQKNFGAEQLRLAPEGLRVESLGDDFDAGPQAFIDTAAVIENLDLVVTIDTSIAHLAGALGKPVWIAIKHVPEWRWLLEREDSPWYPSARLFRQARRGDWNDVFTRMAKALESLLHERRESQPRPVLMPGSIGDLIDRLTILEIKAEKISDAAKRANVSRELALLRQLREQRGLYGGELDALAAALKETNLALWDVEDEIRACEKRQDFGPEFIALARSVYKRNDHRASLKRDINLLCSSRIIEEKSYDE